MSRGTSNDERARAAAEWLARLSHRVPSEAELAALQKWLEHDTENGRIFKELHRLWGSATASPPSAEMLAMLLDAEEQGIAGFPASSPVRRWIRVIKERMTASPIAAAVVACSIVAVTILTIKLQGNPVQLESLTTRVAENKTVVLQDGTTVDLGGRSAIKVKYTHRRRLLELLAGEAYFQDRHYAKWPFVVSAGDVHVRAIGTAFDVERDGDEIAVSVVRGLVELSLTRRLGAGAAAKMPASQINAATLRLRSGDKTVIYADGAIQEYRIDPAEAIAWRAGRLEFNGASLSEAIEAVDRYSLRPIIVAGPTVGAMRITGTVLVSGIGKWVDSLPAVFPLTVDGSNPAAVVLRDRPIPPK